VDQRPRHKILSWLFQTKVMQSRRKNILTESREVMVTAR